MICPLCNKNNANDTGSHFIPYLLIKNIIQADPNEKRAANKSIAFQLGRNETNVTFGRGISQEEIEKILSKGIDEFQPEYYSDFFVVDNKWCSNCEKRFSIIESFFKKVDTKLLEDKNRWFENPKRIEENNLLIRLFFYSIIWRLSISGKSTLPISKSLLENLGNILNISLSLSIKKTIQLSSEIKQDILNVPLLIYSLHHIDDRLKFVFTLKNESPYIYLISNYLLLFWSKDRVFKKCKINFIFLKVSNQKKIEYTNYQENKEGFKITNLSLDDYHLFKKAFLDRKAKERVIT